MWHPIASLVSWKFSGQCSWCRTWNLLGERSSETWSSPFGLRENYLSTQACPTMPEDTFLLLRLGKGRTSAEVPLLTHRYSCPATVTYFRVTYSRTGQSPKCSERGVALEVRWVKRTTARPISWRTWYSCYSKFPLGTKHYLFKWHVVGSVTFTFKAPIQREGKSLWKEKKVQILSIGPKP